MDNDDIDLLGMIVEDRRDTVRDICRISVATTRLQIHLLAIERCLTKTDPEFADKVEAEAERMLAIPGMRDSLEKIEALTAEVIALRIDDDLDDKKQAPTRVLPFKKPARKPKGFSRKKKRTPARA